jgi:hypothetical protein
MKFLKMVVFWVMAPMMVAASTSETSVNYHATSLDNQENSLISHHKFTLFNICRLFVISFALDHI